MFDADSHGSAPAERVLSMKSVSGVANKGVIYQDTYPGHLQNLLDLTPGFLEKSASSQFSPLLRYPTHSPTFKMSTSVKSLG